ncbi:hypothetical protein AJ88_29735 [Mesorhizobium amorphae CCBAU 01583]|nr:hypothetical protein AJ88_29735 [Mesorhizobium amorphae CCBAU 01583]
MATRAFELGRVMAVEQEDGALVAAEVRGRRAIDEEADLGLVPILLPGGEQDRLLGRIGFAVGRMRQEGIVAERPQVLVERIAPLLGAVCTTARQPRSTLRSSSPGNASSSVDSVR